MEEVVSALLRSGDGKLLKLNTILKFGEENIYYYLIPKSA